MSDDLSLLFKIRGDSSGGVKAAAEQRAAIQQLRASAGSNFSAIQNVGQSAFTNIGNSLNVFVSRNIPLLGGALSQTSQGLQSVTSSAEGAAAGVAALPPQISVAIIAALAMTAAAVGLTKAFLELVVSTAEWQGKLFDVSQQTGVNVETLSALEVVAKTTGADIGQLAASLGIFQKNLEEAQDPTSKQSALFKQLGVDTSNTEDALRQTIKSLAEMPEGFEQTAAALAVFGRGGKAFLAIAKETNGDLDGMIARLRELGVVVSTEDAKAADEFNDQLAVLGFQIRSTTALLVQDAIPAILQGAKAVSEIVKENRDTINALGTVISLFVESNVNQILLPALKTLEFVLGSVRNAWIGTIVTAKIAAGEYADAGLEIARINEEIQKINEGLKAGEGSLGTGPIQGGLGGQRLADIKAQADAESRAAKEKIANAQIAFDQGQITREKESAQILGAIAQEENARLEALDAEIAIKTQARDARKDDIAEQQKIGDEITKLSQDRLNVISDFDQKIKAEQSKALADQNKALIDHLESQLALRQKATDNEIKLIQDAIKNNEVAASAGEAAITEIQITALNDRRSVLSQELALHGLSADQRKQITQKIAELEIEATNTQREQSERRKQILRDEYDERLRIIQQANARELALISARDDLLIAREEALATARIKSNEDAARAILAIRVQAIRAEIDQLGQQRAAAVALPDRKRGDEIEADLINRQKILQLQLEKIQLEGNAAVERARQQDLDNAQKYADELTRIGEQAVAAAKAAAGAAANAGGDPNNLLKEQLSTVNLLRGAYENLASSIGQGVGSIVENFVLLGEVGPNAFRKVLASALATVAAQAAVQAIYELALGFAALTPWGAAIYGPAVLHFKAAALLGSIAGVAAVAGRAVAGDLFKKESDGGSSKSGTSSGGSRGSTQIATQDINRRAGNVVNVTIQLHGDIATDALKTKVVNAVVESLDLNDSRLTTQIQGAARRIN